MHILRSVLACMLLILAIPRVEAIDLAGTVERIQGAATATGGNGFSRPLQAGSTILVGDRIITSTNSRLRLRMNDGAVLTLGDNSQMTIDAYDEDEISGQAIMGVVEGIFLATTGAIARLGPERFTITTPTATLGVRGTEVWGEQLSDRISVAMLSGTTVLITTSQGAVELTMPESGVDLVAGEAPPDPKPWGAERLARARAAVSFD